MAFRPSFCRRRERFSGNPRRDSAVSGLFNVCQSSVVGSKSKRLSLPFAETCLRQGSLAPPALPGFLATMNPADSRPGRSAVIHSRQALVSRPPARVSQVPRRIFRCPLSSLTPEGSVAALTRVFATDAGFAPPERMATFGKFNEAETGSMTLRLTSLSSRASTEGLLPQPPSRLHGARAFTMVKSFHLTRLARLRLTHQE